MKWQACLAVLISVLCITFPANIIGCAEVSNSYDEYISFFRNDLSSAKSYSPFYYIQDLPLYESQATSVTNDHGTDWARYCHNRASSNQADSFVYNVNSAELTNLIRQLSGQQHKKIGRKLQANPFVQWLVQTRNRAVLDYLMLLRQAEAGNASGILHEWEPHVRDSLAVRKLIDTALARRDRIKDPFLKNRYAFVAARMAYYNGQAKESVRYFDQMLASGTAGKELYADALGFKAGALLRLGRDEEAAYDYSKAFSIRQFASDYVSFGFCVKRHSDADRAACLNFCRNDREKADLMGLFLLGSAFPEAASLIKLAKYAADAPILEVLVVREVNKIERNYLTPLISKQKGGKSLTMLYLEDGWYEEHHSTNKWLQEAQQLGSFSDSLARSGKVPHPALYATISAYLSYIRRQYKQADAQLSFAESLPAAAKVRDQQKMIRLLLSISQYQKIDPVAEAALLPSIRWLEKKASADSKAISDGNYGWNAPGLWRQLYRNLFSMVLAKRYYQQHDAVHEALCIGAAEAMINNAPDMATNQTLTHLQNNMSAGELVAIWNLQHQPQKNDWDRYLCNVFAVEERDEPLVISAAELREYQFGKATYWLRQVKNKKDLKLLRHPFGRTYLDCNDSLFDFDNGKYNRLAFTMEMDRLMKKVRRGTATAANLAKLGTGYYNMTYYGRDWQLVKFYKSTMEKYEIPANPTPFQKDYYWCYTAEHYYKKAMEASKDKEFKAQCLFLMAKCAQHQVRLPSLDNYKDWEKEDSLYYTWLVDNRYFPQLIRDYSHTEFYEQAWNSCSYLRDFVPKR